MRRAGSHSQPRIFSVFVFKLLPLTHIRTARSGRIAMCIASCNKMSMRKPQLKCHWISNGPNVHSAQFSLISIFSLSNSVPVNDCAVLACVQQCSQTHVSLNSLPRWFVYSSSLFHFFSSAVKLLFNWLSNCSLYGIPIYYFCIDNKQSQLHVQMRRQQQRNMNTTRLCVEKKKQITTR